MVSQFKIWRRLAIAALAFACANCSPTDKPTNTPTKTERLDCLKYLGDTGYHIIDSDAEKKRLMDALGVPADEQIEFCLGRLPKPTGGFCYVALPADARTDGEHTDCPYEVLR